MVEKEIPINIMGAPTPGAPSVASVSGAPSENPEKHNDEFNAAVGDFSANLTQTTTNDELLDKLLNAPENDLLPWHTITLPSRGAYYNGKIPGGIVRARPMGIQADKILATQQLAQSGQSIDYLFQNCVELPNGFDQGELLAGDRVFLLYVLRGITHGNKYEFMITCPNCSGTNTYIYDLNELGSTVTVPKPELGPEPFKVILPYLSKVIKREAFVRVRLLRGNDITAMTKRQKFKKRVTPVGARNIPRRQIVTKQDAIDDTLSDNLNMVVVDWMGEVNDVVKIKRLVERLHSSDTAEIREFLRENSPGIDTQIEVTCPQCNNKFNTELPITETFFRPSKS